MQEYILYQMPLDDIPLMFRQFTAKANVSTRLVVKTIMCSHLRVVPRPLEGHTAVTDWPLESGVITHQGCVHI